MTILRKTRRINAGVRDGDLIEARSFSLATKQRMQRQRSAARLARRDEEWRHVMETQVAVPENVARLFGDDD